MAGPFGATGGGREGQEFLHLFPSFVPYLQLPPNRKRTAPCPSHRASWERGREHGWEFFTLHLLEPQKPGLLLDQTNLAVSALKSELRIHSHWLYWKEKKNQWRGDGKKERHAQWKPFLSTNLSIIVHIIWRIQFLHGYNLTVLLPWVTNNLLQLERAPLLPVLNSPLNKSATGCPLYRRRRMFSVILAI